MKWDEELTETMATYNVNKTMYYNKIFITKIFSANLSKIFCHELQGNNRKKTIKNTGGEIADFYQHD